VLEDLVGRPPAEALRGEQQAVAAILGKAQDPGLTVSQLLSTFEKFTRDERLQKSDEQIHKWRLHLLRAANNLRGLIGD
jgi:hypothetical protein